MKRLHDEEYLCIPDATDLKMMIALHKEHHQEVDGMFVKMDYMLHTG